MYVFAFVVQQYFAHNTFVTVVGNDVDNHTVLVVGEDVFTLFEKILYKLLFMKVSVYAVVFDKMAAPGIFSSE